MMPLCFRYIAMYFRHAPPWQTQEEDQPPALLNGMSFEGRHKLDCKPIGQGNVLPPLA